MNADSESDISAFEQVHARLINEQIEKILLGGVGANYANYATEPPASFTAESLAAARYHLTRGQRVAVGIAMAPSTHAAVRQQNLNPPGIGQLPEIVDPRMSGKDAHVYYDLTLWRARCQEQREWDSQISANQRSSAIQSNG